MARKLLVRKNAYFDSVFLMRVARQIASQAGVGDASAVMGTEANCKLLSDMGYDPRELSVAGSNDLVIAVEGEAATVGTVLADPDRWFQPPAARGAGKKVCRDLDEAVGREGAATLAVISVPGQYAAAEARKALAHDLNVFLFSSNVSVEDELSLKRDARAKGTHRDGS